MMSRTSQFDHNLFNFNYENNFFFKDILGSSNLDEYLTKNRFNKNYKNSVLIT